MEVLEAYLRPAFSPTPPTCLQSRRDQGREGKVSEDDGETRRGYLERMQCWSPEGIRAGQSGPPARCSAVEGLGEAGGWVRAIANMPRAQPGSQVPPHSRLGRTKAICLDLEYRPCLESGNAPEGTSKNV